MFGTLANMWSVRTKYCIETKKCANTKYIRAPPCPSIDMVTSIPTCRKNWCAEKNNRYFDLKHLKICAHLNISYNFL
jgi:hypothetical protein